MLLLLPISTTICFYLFASALLQTFSALFIFFNEVLPLLIPDLINFTQFWRSHYDLFFDKFCMLLFDPFCFHLTCVNYVHMLILCSSITVFLIFAINGITNASALWLKWYLIVARALICIKFFKFLKFGYKIHARIINWRNLFIVYTSHGNMHRLSYQML